MANCLHNCGVFDITPESVKIAVSEGKIPKNKRGLGEKTWKEIMEFAGLIETPVKLPNPGMSLRDWFAGMALQGIISGSAHPLFDDHGNNRGMPENTIHDAMVNGPGKTGVDDNSPVSDWAWIAYASADAMLAARDRKESA
jgi:hypothetical protein